MCANLYQEDFDIVKEQLFGEALKYRHNAVWSDEFKGIVEEELGGEIGESPPGIGIARRTRNGPFHITVSKTNVPTVTERKDFVRARGLELTVIRIEEEDAGSWRLYCAS